jgi:hypothetical protein
MRSITAIDPRTKEKVRCLIASILNKNKMATVEWLSQRNWCLAMEIEASIQKKHPHDFFWIDQDRIHHLSCSITREPRKELAILDSYLDIANSHQGYSIKQIDLVLHPKLDCVYLSTEKCDRERVNIWELPSIDPVLHPSLIPLLIFNLYPATPQTTFGKIFQNTRELPMAQKKIAWRQSKILCKYLEENIIT